jgi:tetratricopeptide (TPR) repeat protein
MGDLGQLPPESQKFAEALAHYSVGLMHLARREDKEALQEWERVVLLDPSRTDLREQIAQQFFRRNDFAKAIEVLEDGTRQDPRSASLWSQLALAYYSSQKPVQAVEAAEKALRLDPTTLSSYRVLYDIAIEQKDVDKARKILEQANAQKSDNYLYWLRLADLQAGLNSREPKLALPKESISQLYDKALALQPDNLETMEHAANYGVLCRDLDKAVQLYLKILGIQPNATSIREKLALCFVADGNKERALEVLREIVQREPLRYQIFFLMGELNEDLKKPDVALENYRSSLSINPNQLAPYLRIVLLELRNKRPAEALKQLDLAAAKFPNTFQVTYFYGLTYSETKEYARAVESFEKALELGKATSPSVVDGTFYFYYGAALERNGEFDKAVAQFEKSLELNPDYADAYNYLGFMYADKNIKLDEASRLIEKALNYEPENGAFLDSMGWVYYRQGKFDQALIYLQRAVKVIANDAVIFDHLGDVYFQMGNCNEALTSYQKAVELDPKNKEVKEKLENARRTLSNTKPAATPSPVPQQ